MMQINLKRPKGVTVTKAKAYCGRHAVPLLILSPVHKPANVPGVLWIHGGGYFSGMKEMVYMSRAVDLVRTHGAVIVSPGYRLAVCNPYPAALEDCYAALLWLKEHHKALGVCSEQLMVGGESAGGGLAVAVCMKAREEGTVQIAYQMPLYPMLSNVDTESSKDNHGRFWNTRLNHFGWRLYLRSAAKKQVSPLASPLWQTDYSNLPPCYTFVGDGEPFYTETLEYIRRLNAVGVPAAVDVYPSNVHAFDMLYPASALSKKAAREFNDRFAYAKKTYFAAQTDL